MCGLTAHPKGRFLMPTTSQRANLYLKVGAAILMAILVATGIVVSKVAYENGREAGRAEVAAEMASQAVLIEVTENVRYVDMRPSPELSENQRAYVVPIPGTSSEVAKGTVSNDFTVTADAKFSENNGRVDGPITFSASTISDETPRIIAVNVFTPSDDPSMGSLKMTPYLPSQGSTKATIAASDLMGGAVAQVLVEV